MADLCLRTYKEGDELQILELFKQTFGRDMGIDYWNWRFRDNVEGKIQIELMYDEELLVGHYAVAPAKMNFNNKLALTALSNNTMINPDYGRRGIFTKLASNLYARIKDYGVQLVWGFPNQASYHGFVHRLNWLPIKDIPTLTLSKDNLKHFNLAQPKHKVETISHFDPAFDDLWDRLRNEFASRFRYFVVRDSKYLNWRYVQNPKYQYKIFCVRKGDNYLGYAVTKFYSGGEQLMGDIVDIFCIFDKDVFLSLIQESINYLSQSASQICCWMNESCQFYEYLKEAGFVESSFVTHFGARPLLSLAEGEREYLAHYSNWYLTMGDSDVY